MQGSMRWVVAALALTATVVFVAVAAGASHAATTRIECNDISYLNWAIRAAKHNVNGWKATQRDQYGSAITLFKKARWAASSSPVPCEYKYLKTRRYSIEQYDASIHYVQELRYGSSDEADYWYDQQDYYSDLVSIWMN